MKLSQLIANDFFLPLEWDREFEHLVADSRLVQRGDLFVARAEVGEHAEQYIDAAVANGAVAVLVAGEMGFDSKESPFFARVPVFYIEQVSTHYAIWLARRYPLNDMSLIGVTGTNGKSSVTQYIAQLAQQPCAVQGTLGNGIWPALTASANTTADLSIIRRQLNSYQQQGVQLAAMEVSSHGLAQQRVAGLEFAVAIMTNLSQDHLDYHGSMQAYYQAKKQLFTEYPVTTAVINIDDDYGMQLANDAAVLARKITYGTSAQADVYYQLQALTDHGMQAQIVSPWGEATLQLPLLGEFNLANTVAAIVALTLLGEDFQQLCAKAANLRPVAGRMEIYQKPNSASVIVDFAHTPAALANVLQALKPWQRSVTTVFGCGGDRDRSKRPLMMQAALADSDIVWLTDDNVRFEDPEQIFSDILVGGFTAYQVHDRTTAIRSAIEQAPANGLVLIAGKGHENYQDIQGVKHPYSDQAVLAALGYQAMGGAHA